MSNLTISPHWEGGWLLLCVFGYEGHALVFYLGDTLTVPSWDSYWYELCIALKPWKNMSYVRIGVTPNPNTAKLQLQFGTCRHRERCLVRWTCCGKSTTTCKKSGKPHRFPGNVIYKPWVCHIYANIWEYMQAFTAGYMKTASACEVQNIYATNVGHPVPRPHSFSLS